MKAKARFKAIRVVRPDSPFDKPNQRHSWEKGFHAGYNRSKYQPGRADEWQIGWRAGQKYLETIRQFKEVA